MKAAFDKLPFTECLSEIDVPFKLPKSEYLQEGSLPVISQEREHISGYWNNHKDSVKVSRPVVIFGDHTRVLKYIETDFIVGADGVKVFQTIEKILPKFFFYFLHTVQFEDLGYSRYYKVLKSLKVPIPPLPEQKRIVAILDEAFAGLAVARANAERNLENARELFEGYLESVFSQGGVDWIESSLGDICRFENGDRGNNYPHRSEYVEDGIPWINTGHILPDGTLSREEMNYITRKKFDSLRSGKIQAGDVVYCLRGNTLGKTALVAPFAEGAVASSLVILRPSKLLESRFLYFYLISPPGKKLIRGFENGAAQPNLGAKSVAKYPISYPPIKVQIEIANQILEFREETQGLAHRFGEKLKAIDSLKGSILQKSFGGV